jgi:hypothetical protein
MQVASHVIVYLASIIFFFLLHNPKKKIHLKSVLGLPEEEKMALHSHCRD